jgi:hypothetical protein
MRPWRAEPLVCLARHWAAQSRHDAALHALEQARRIPYPAQDVLFVEPDAYGDSVEELVSISGFYSAIPQRKHDGMRAAEALAIRATCTPQVRETARRNLFFYSRPVGELCPGVAATRLEVALPEPYVAMNTSVAADGDGYIAIVRGVNYRLAGGRYDIADPARVVRTRNFVVRLRADLTIASLREIADRSSLPRHESAFIRGFEDCRLFRWQGRWHCSATARDVGADGRATMVLLAMDGACDIEAATVLSGFGDHLHQKNWMPAVGERLRFVYSCGPAVVVDASAPAGCVVVESMQDPGADLTHWRGGTQLVPWREGFLAVVHEAKDAPAGRQYLHRFVQFNEAAVPVAATPAFHFIAPGIEFASGLLAEQGAAGPQLLVTLGVGDCEAWAVRLPGEAVAAVLKPLEAK